MISYYTSLALQICKATKTKDTYVYMRSMQIFDYAKSLERQNRPQGMRDIQFAFPGLDIDKLNVPLKFQQKMIQIFGSIIKALRTVISYTSNRIAEASGEEVSEVEKSQRLPSVSSLLHQRDSDPLQPLLHSPSKKDARFSDPPSSSSNSLPPISQCITEEEMRETLFSLDLSDKEVEPLVRQVLDDEVHVSLPLYNTIKCLLFCLKARIYYSLGEKELALQECLFFVETLQKEPNNFMLYSAQPFFDLMLNVLWDTKQYENIKVVLEYSSHLAAASSAWKQLADKHRGKLLLLKEKETIRERHGIHRLLNEECNSSTSGENNTIRDKGAISPPRNCPVKISALLNDDESEDVSNSMFPSFFARNSVVS